MDGQHANHQLPPMVSNYMLMSLESAMRELEHHTLLVDHVTPAAVIALGFTPESISVGIRVTSSMGAPAVPSVFRECWQFFSRAQTCEALEEAYEQYRVARFGDDPHPPYLNDPVELRRF